MRLRHLFAANAVASLWLAVAFVVAPPSLLPSGSLSPAGLMISQLCCGLHGVLGLALLSPGLRAIDHSTLGRATGKALMLFNLLGLAGFLQATLQGVINGLGWVAVAIYGLLCVGYRAVTLRLAQQTLAVC